MESFKPNFGVPGRLGGADFYHFFTACKSTGFTNQLWQVPYHEIELGLGDSQLFYLIDFWHHWGKH